MGYGQFGGTGSVEWKIVDRGHSKNGDPPDKKDGKSKDRPKGEGGEFIVVVNGLEVARLQIDDDNDNQIRVIWTPDTLATVP